MHWLHAFVFVWWATCLCQLTVLGGRLTPVARKPPVITKQGPLEKVFKVGETVTLPCRASGSPAPTYRWTKDEKDLEERQLSPASEDGILTLDVATETDQGIYQCYAANRYGVAVTVKTALQMAVLDPFPSVREPKVHRTPVGRPLTLHCNQPFSFPASTVYWGENRKESKMKTVETNERISLDYKGNLHFANVLPEDHRGGLTYVCVVFNPELRSLVQGDDQKIDVQRSAGSPRQEPPRLVFSSPIPEVAIKGQTKKLICIFSGFPTPRVTWKRLDLQMSEKVEYASHGQELVIASADFDDAGRYQCEGENGVASSAKDIILVVESPPYWRNGRSPDDVIASEEDDITVSCQVNGVPKPAITWSINGVLLNYVPENPRRSVGADFFRINNVTESDTQVIQCNASNSHGYLFANVFINVLAEPPTFVSTPQKETRLSVGQSVILSCRAYGAPKPTVEWKRGRQMEDVIPTTNPGAVDNGHFEILENGDLSIKNAQRIDEDTYHCLISNKFGSEVSSGDLLVRERTVIMDRPDDQLVVAGSESVIFRCNASTDQAEKDRLRIEWSKDGTTVPAGDDDDHRYSVEDGGRRLIIRNVQVSDTGSYTCQASNGLDIDSQTAKLTVKGPPDPPIKIRLTSCSSKTAEVTWTPGNDNNDPITGYIVYFNTSHDEAGKYEEGARVNSTARHSARIQLRPWANYTFHVVAENAVGLSGKSETTQGLCTTLPARPYRNPRRVCTDSRSPSQLVIVWEPMLQAEHNGPGFHYVVTYRSLGSSLPSTEVRRQVLDWRQSEQVVNDQPTFEEYEISVQAANSVGTAHGTLDRMIGYSGEDVPLERPRNFRLIDESLNDTSAAFVWDAVKEDRKTIRGFFQGYQIRFWKSADPGNVRTEDVIVHPWSPCRPVIDRPRHGEATDHRSVQKRMVTTTIEGLTTKLWPFSTITAGVLVISGTKQSQLSDAIEFNTPEGVPDVVPAFWVSERGSHHLRLSWSAPFEVNGLLRGYGIAYKEAPPAIDTWKETYSTYPDLTYRKIHNLKSDTVYLITIWAETNAGSSPKMTIEETTVSDNEPDKPTIESIESGYDFVNVSWLPSGDEAPRSPGSDFIVEYRRMGAEAWQQSANESQHNWLNVTVLKHGEAYEFRVRASNRKGDSMVSDIMSARVGFKQEAVVQKAASYGWVAAFVCILLLLGAGLVAFVVIKRNRGGIYPVYKKEKLQGNEKRVDKEPAFGEYVRTEDSTVKTKSQGSLETSSSQSQEEATDSLGIYDDGSSAKFNEDGSILPDKPEAKPVPPQLESTNA